MKSREIAQRYAEALHRLAVEEDSQAEIESDYQEVLAEIEGVPRLQFFLSHPLVPRENKRKLIDIAFPDICSYLRNLFYLLIRNGREGYLGLIYEEFLARRAEQEGRIQIGITTAQALSEQDRTRLENRLESLLGGTVSLKERVDPGLLGGVRLEMMGGRVIDGTLQARLNRLKTLLER
jgi:F-type H+-transporting ATPase subunit delta